MCTMYNVHILTPRVLAISQFKNCIVEWEWFFFRRQNWNEEKRNCTISVCVWIKKWYWDKRTVLLTSLNTHIIFLKFIWIKLLYGFWVRWKRTRPFTQIWRVHFEIKYIEKFEGGMGRRVEFKCFVMQCFIKDRELDEGRTEVSCDKYWILKLRDFYDIRTMASEKSRRLWKGVVWFVGKVVASCKWETTLKYTYTIQQFLQVFGIWEEFLC